AARHVRRRPRRTAGALAQLRERLLERDTARLERDGVDVGDVVADHVHADLVVAQARDAGEEGTHHGCVAPGCWLLISTTAFSAIAWAPHTRTGPLLVNFTPSTCATVYVCEATAAPSAAFTSTL